MLPHTPTTPPQVAAGEGVPRPRLVFATLADGPQDGVVVGDADAEVLPVGRDHTVELVDRLRISGFLGPQPQLQGEHVQGDEPLLAVDEVAAVPRRLVVDEGAEELLRRSVRAAPVRGVARPVPE